MAPAHSAATSAKRGARARAPPNPSPATPADGSNLVHQLLQAACDGDLRLLKRLVRALDEGRPREAVEAAKDDGVGALHVAARNGRLPVCRYLVEQLGVDVDTVDDKGATPLAWAILAGSVDTMSYVLGHGVSLSKADYKGFTPLHHAAGTGDCKMVELLLAEGVSVDPVSVCGTPLHVAASHGNDEAMKILLENNADSEYRHARTITELMSLAANSMKRNDYLSAAVLYSAAIEHDRHDATLFSNRSLCCLHMGYGHEALQNALTCREMRPDWPKGRYRQGAALMFLKDYKGACDAFLAAAKLDPLSPEIEAALRQALNSLKISRGTARAV